MKVYFKVKKPKKDIEKNSKTFLHPNQEPKFYFQIKNLILVHSFRHQVNPLLINKLNKRLIEN